MLKLVEQLPRLWKSQTFKWKLFSLNSREWKIKIKTYMLRNESEGYSYSEGAPFPIHINGRKLKNE
ncbi:hypothetical protein CFK37_10855 [Virgibacillus phasianinus]|uniref:Uncharacterized protein n=1 Tax=Virgibacillus phasianinus TaxID=2017483 RepID=A0A220U3X7_9BACI|nr:hypothetical protein CFK37_10855 [Virgibacillus phasianinus]